MNLSRKLLAEYLKVAALLTSGRFTIPILASTRLELVHRAKGPHLRIHATNLDQHLEAELPVDVGPSDGQTLVACVPTKVLTRTVRETKSPEVSIVLPGAADFGFVKVDGQQVTAGPADEFPDAPGSSLAFEPFPYLEMGRVVSAASFDESRYALNGIYLDFKVGALVATDGHRLHVNRCMPPKPAMPSVILPRAAVNAALRAPTMPAISLTKDMVTIPLREGRLVSRTIDGTFVNYEAVIPKRERMKTVLEVNPAELRAAVKASLAFSENSNHPTTLVLNGNIAVKASSVDKGAFELTVPGAYIGKTLTIRFNGTYIMDALDATGVSTALTIRFQDALSPALIEHGRLTVVIMPMGA